MTRSLELAFPVVEPWATLSGGERILRALRISFGVLMLLSFSSLGLVGLVGIFHSSTVLQVLSSLVVIPVVWFMAWVVGRMFVWRGVREMPEVPPAEFPHVPRPRPILPLFLSAHAPLPVDEVPNRPLQGTPGSGHASILTLGARRPWAFRWTC